MVRAARIVPAILTDNPQALETMVRQAESFTDYVQFDIMDGQFVPTRSITHHHLAALNTRLSWEAHLMVQNPERYLPGFRQAGAKKVVFHYEATPAPLEVISLAQKLGLEIGLAVNPETQVADFLPLASRVDSILFLTVHPGFYGSPFQPQVLDKIEEFRKARPDAEVGVDGGIKEGNISEIARFGVDVFYVGSAIFRQPNPAESFRRLQRLAQRGMQPQGL